MSQIKEKNIPLIKSKLFLIQTSIAILEEKYRSYFTKEDTEMLLKIKNAVTDIDKEVSD